MESITAVNQDKRCVTGTHKSITVDPYGYVMFCLFPVCWKIGRVALPSHALYETARNISESSEVSKGGFHQSPELVELAKIH